MDNWVSAIIARIEHTKCKHEITDLESRLQQLAKDASLDETKNPSRRQFLAYLEQLDPELGGMLQEVIKNIHNYKQSCMKAMDLNKRLHDGDHSIIEELNSTQDEIETVANEILGDIFSKLKRAKMSLNPGEFNEIPEVKEDLEESKAGNTEESAEIAENIAELTKNSLTNSENSRRRKHFATHKNMDKVNYSEISIENIKFKLSEYKEIQPVYQVLLLCPPRIFIILHKNFIKMKEDKRFDKYLFRKLEDTINLLYKENFEVGKMNINHSFHIGFMKEITWNRSFNKIINDSNQYLFENTKQEPNIFVGILQQHRMNVMK